MVGLIANETFKEPSTFPTHGQKTLYSSCPPKGHRWPHYGDRYRQRAVKDHPPPPPANLPQASCPTDRESVAQEQTMCWTGPHPTDKASHVTPGQRFVRGLQGKGWELPYPLALDVQPPPQSAGQDGWDDASFSTGTPSTCCLLGLPFNVRWLPILPRCGKQSTQRLMDVPKSLRGREKPEPESQPRCLASRQTPAPLTKFLRDLQSRGRGKAS